MKEAFTLIPKKGNLDKLKYWTPNQSHFCAWILKF